ncbi:MAG: GDSL-type esterase/lipase family protein [bacterium]|nr:GDSL-type esterase/lipase family protein [bacterium]
MKKLLNHIACSILIISITSCTQNTKTIPKKVFDATFNQELTKSNLPSPNDIQIKNTQPTKIYLKWNYPDLSVSTSKNTAKEYAVHSGYRIYRDGHQYADILSLNQEFIDANLYPGETYTYKIAALSFDNKIEGEISKEIIATTKKSEIEKSTPFLKKNYSSYLAEGDSITQGQRAANNNGWVDLITNHLNAKHPISTSNFGTTGVVASDINSRISKDLSELSPDLVTIAVGLNDLYASFPQNEYLSKLKNIIKISLPSTTRKVVLLDIYMMKAEENNPVLRSRRIAWNKSLRDLAYTSKIDIATVGNALESSGGYKLLDDDLHPNSKGHEAIAKEVIRYLNY